MKKILLDLMIIIEKKMAVELNYLYLERIELTAL